MSAQDYLDAYEFGSDIPVSSPAIEEETSPQLGAFSPSLDEERHIRLAGMIPNYSNIAVSTATIDVRFRKGCHIINLCAFHHLQPITKIILPPRGNRTRKTKVPFVPGNSGAVYSSGFHDSNRGIIINTMKKNFNHAIGSLVSISHTNVFLKISEINIHATGTKSMEDDKEIFRHINRTVVYVHRMIGFIQENLTLARSTAEWVLRLTYGNPILRRETVNGFDEYGNKILMENYIPDATLEYHYVEPIGEIHRELAMMFLSYATDYQYHRLFREKLEFVLSYPGPIATVIDFDHTEIYMSNRNFHLGFMIDREKVFEHMHGKNGFVIICNPAKSQIVAKLLFRPVQGQYLTNRNGKRLTHSFTMRCTGNVTFSNRGNEEAAAAYNLFWETILSIRPFVEYTPHAPAQNNLNCFDQFLTQASPVPSYQVSNINHVISNTSALSQIALSY